MAIPGEEDEAARPGSGGDGPLEADQELAFADREDRLPWLEADDDLDEPGADTGRIIAFAAVGVLALVLIVGAIWWFSRDHGPANLVADGSTIAAPEEPYKTRPAEPGGREVEGTGDSSFKVAEGQSVEGRVAPTGVPAPSIDREQAGSKLVETGGKIVPAAGVGVQVGAYSSRQAAETGWNELAGRYEALKGAGHRIIEGQVDGGKVFRLQAVADDAAGAEALCRSMKAAGGDCQVKR